jgi:tetrahydromethanopterin S-methyltransferase subunit E
VRDAEGLTFDELKKGSTVGVCFGIALILTALVALAFTSGNPTISGIIASLGGFVIMLTLIVSLAIGDAIVVQEEESSYGRASEQ